MRNFYRSLGGLLVLLMVTAAPAATSTHPAAGADLVGLDVLVADGQLRVELTASGEWTHRTFTMSDPNRLVVDLVGMVQRIDAGAREGDGQLATRVRTSQFATTPQPITRVVLDLVGEPHSTVQRTERGLVVELTPAQATAPTLPEPLRQGAALTLPTDELVSDHWQDDSGLGRIAEPGRREDDASYARTMNLNMQNADIKTILRAIADFSGRNIIASPAVEGQVTVALHEVPWREALSVILKSHGFGFVEEDGILRVDSAENIRNEELAEKAALKKNDELEALITRIVPIDFAHASDIKTAMQSMLTTRGSIEVDERTNALIVNDIPANVDNVARLAHDLDTKTPQVHIDALLVDLDARRSQEYGVDWGLFNFHKNNAAGDVSVTNPITDVSGQLRVGTVQDFGEMRITLQALAKDNVANIISNPRITTTDNREATILVGQKIPLITTDVAGNPITRLETIGIRLVVTPHINSDRQITLDVHPEVSDLSSQATVQGGVIINTSEADTRVLVNNSETAVIGGLIRSVTSTFSAGVPVLKDLPLLGALFRSEAKNDEQRELLVFLTPTIVTDDSVADPREQQIKDSVDQFLEENASTGL